MTVRGTENFVYYLDKTLGAGSTGTVYFGRHKRKGDPCAAKLFTRSESLSKVRVKQNEIDFMRMLDHTNIVRFLAIEEDTRTKESVLLMELCTEGSLQKLLSEPENVFGLNEDLLLKCFTQFIKGLEYLMLHGVIHRDVKPGNILCSKSDDGSLIFKLTDFGATREMAGNVSANALFGTEEYLHPETYRCVLLEKVPLPSELEQNAEIWSIGVTVYHIVTGQLPFQAYGGRSNRETMYRIISTKDHGVISGIQTEAAGDIAWRRDLPETCSASRGLRDKLVPIIANTVEREPRLQWTFEQLFPACESLYKSTVVVVFYVVTCSYIRIYLDAANTSFEALKDAIFRQTNVAVDHIVLIYNNKLLVEPVNSAGSQPSSSRAEVGSQPSTSRADEVGSSVLIFPLSSEETPIVLTTNALWEYQQIQTAQPSKPSMTSSEPTLASDAVWSRDASAFCYRYLLTVQFLNRAQVFIQQTKMVLIDELKSLVEIVQLSVGDLKENFVAVRGNVCRTEREVRQFLGDLPAKCTAPSSRSSPNKEFESLMAKCVKDLNNLMRSLMDSLSKTEKVKNELELKAGKVNVPPTIVSLQMTECEQRRCIHKVRQWFQRSRDVRQKFTDDKKRQLTYNEDQIHRYERLKLGELEDTVANEVVQHCIPQTLNQHRDFHLWFSGLYLKVKLNIEDCNKLTKQLRDYMRQVLLEQESVRRKLFDYNTELTLLLNKGGKTKSTGLLSALFTRSTDHSHTVPRSPTEPQISRSSEQLGEHSRSLYAATADVRPVSTASDSDGSCLSSTEVVCSTQPHQNVSTQDVTHMLAENFKSVSDIHCMSAELESVHFDGDVG